MRWIMLAISAICLGGWIYIGSTANLMGLPVPALGEFYHPTNGFWRNTLPKHTFPLNATVSLSHPNAKGEVFYDDRSVPHIFTETLEDAIFLQGYVTARDRLWQMDLSTRSTGGRLAEILGEQVAGRDRRQIRHGYRAAAELAVTSWKTRFPEDYQLVETYCAGVNAYIDALDPLDYPVEYKLLNHAPVRWTPYHVALMIKGMTQSMTDRSEDARFSQALRDLGPAKFRELYPLWYSKQTPIIPSGTNFNFKEAALRDRSPLPVVSKQADGLSFLEPTIDPTSEETHFFPFDYRPGNGSNNWAIAGSKSTTRKPILAGDPHLGLSLPSIWYEVQINTQDINCRGVSLPGVPLVIIGFNEDIAWSMTNGGEDVVDYYRMDWLDETRQRYRVGEDTLNVSLRNDTLLIKGAPTEIVSTKWTVRGPIAVVDSSSAYEGLAKDAIYLYTQTDRPGTELTTFRSIMQASNYAEFKAGLRSYSEPIMNFAYADNRGDIAMLSAGFWPNRGKRETGNQNNQYPGLTVSDGSLPDPNWSSYLPFEHLPEQYNPQRGFVSSANQPPTDEKYPYLYYGGFPTWRGRYINRKLAQGKRFGQQEMKALQQDAHGIMAEELMPLLLAKINRKQLNQSEMTWFRMLADWDYDFTKDNLAATFFERWRRRVFELTTDELTSEQGYPTLPLWRWMELLREAPNHEIFDLKTTPTRESAATLTQRAFDEIIENIDDDPIVSWNEERSSSLNHLGQIPGFGFGPLIANGERNTPNALSGSHGPSWRMVVELGETPRAWGVFPGGASGNPGSPNFISGVDEWSKGRYFDLPLWKTAREATDKATHQLTFE